MRAPRDRHERHASTCMGYVDPLLTINLHPKAIFYHEHNNLSCRLPHSLKSGDKGGSLRTVSDTAGVLRLFSGGKGIAVTAAY